MSEIRKKVFSNNFLSSSNSIFLFVILLSLFFVTPLISPGIILDSDIRLFLSDYNQGPCGGILNNSGQITNWDGFCIFSFTLGVANFDSESHSLEQAIITMVTTISERSSLETNETISTNGGLPAILHPNRYWNWNFTCPYGTYRITVLLILDGVMMDFGALTYHDSGFHTQFLTSWPNMQYHTISTSSVFPSFSLIISIIGIVILRRLKNRST